MPTKTTQKKIPELRFPEFSGEWSLLELGSVGKIATGSTPPTENRSFYGGEYQFISPVDMNDGRYIKSTNTTLSQTGYKRSRKIAKKSVLFVGIGSTIGKVAQTLTEATSNQQIHSISAGKENDNNFLYYRILKNAPRIKLLAGVQAVPQLNKSDFSKVKLHFPDKSEQQKIANFLGAVDGWIENLKAQKAKLEEYKRGMMQKIFSQEVRFKDDNGKDFPEWEEKKLEEVCVAIKSGGTPTSTNKEYYDGDIPFLSISDMTRQGKHIEKTEKTITQKGLENSAAWLLPKNTLIYSMYASVGLVSINKIPLATSQAMINLTLDLKKADLYYMYYFLTYFKKAVHRFIETGTQGNLNSKLVKNFDVPLPLIYEQQKIADFLSSIDALIEAKDQQIEKAETWKKGLLQKMFV